MGGGNIVLIEFIKEMHIKTVYTVVCDSIKKKVGVCTKSPKFSSSFYVT